MGAPRRRDEEGRARPMPRRRLGVGGHQSKPREAGSLLARCALRAAFPGVINNDSKPVAFLGFGPSKTGAPRWLGGLGRAR